MITTVSASVRSILEEETYSYVFSLRSVAWRQLDVWTGSTCCSSGPLHHNSGWLANKCSRCGTEYKPERFTLNLSLIKSPTSLALTCLERMLESDVRVEPLEVPFLAPKLYRRLRLAASEATTKGVLSR